MRVAAWQPPREPEAAPVTAQATSAPARTDDLFAPAFVAQPSRFESSPSTTAEAGAFRPWTPQPAPPAAWIDAVFTNVAALDGRTLQAGELRIRLAGLDLPMPEQMCRTLDGRFEPCTSRATTQLDLLTRHRPITCRYRLERAGEALGECRVGASDLVERLVQTGYVWRTAALATGATR
jgi:endonuclease YncB( thermonuclease family)